MKKMTCEMCGSNDIVKQDGVYVCQSCGTKYSVEEARKLLVEIEGTVDVSGSTVKLDNEQRVENIRLLAQRAKEAGDSQNAAKHYNELLIERPDDWEANFYSVYFECQNIRKAEIGNAASRMGSILANVFQILNDNVKGKAEQVTSYGEIGAAVLELYTMYIHNATDSLATASGLDDFYRITDNWVVPSILMVISCIDAMMKYAEYEEEFDMAAQIADSIAYSGKKMLDGAKSESAIISLIESKPRAVREMKEDFEEKIRKQQQEEYEKQEKERKAKGEAYWAVHPEEKKELENRKKTLGEQIAEAQRAVEEAEENLKELSDSAKQPVPAEADLHAVDQKRRELVDRRMKLGFFKGKEKKQLTEQIAVLDAKIDEQRDLVRSQKENQQSEFQPKIEKAQEKLKQSRQTLDDLKSQDEKIEEELVYGR